MSDRHKTHNGRDRSGHYKVKQTDVEDLRASPEGADFVRDDVRLGGAVEDTGPDAGKRGKHIGDLVDSNSDDVQRAAGGRKRGAGGRKTQRKGMR